MDPAGTGRGDETGLVAGLYGTDGHQYLTHDASAKMTPYTAAEAAWALFERTESDILVYEDNFGKGWVKEVLTKVWQERRDELAGPPPLQEVWASAGKKLRAQPVVMRHEQNLIHHVGSFPELEDQYTTWIPEEDHNSPDRVDAAVHLHAFFAKRFGTSQVAFTNPHERMAARGRSGIGAAQMGRRVPGRRV
jgi:phage terminase large subunit-like protein